MATDLQTHNEPSLTNLVKGVIDDVQSLTKQQFALLKQELKEDMTKTRKAAMPMVVGLIVAFIGVLLLGHGLALLLHWIFPGLPETVDTVKETIQETVSTVSGTVHNTVEAVKDTVADTAESVKSFFDIPHQVDRHPWLMMGGSVLLGYLGGRLLLPRRSAADEG